MTPLSRRGFVRGLGLTMAAAASTPRRASAGQTLRIGTVHAAGSVPGTLLAQWAQDVSDQTGGQLTLQIFYSSSQGDETTMATKISAGTLEGAMLSSQGLSRFSTNLQALEMPGLFNSWTELDQARASVGPDYIAPQLASADVKLLGWTDHGVVRLMNRGATILLPAGLAGRHIWLPHNNLVLPTFYAQTSAQSVALSDSQVLSELEFLHIDSLFSSSFTAAEYTWGTQLTEIHGNYFGVRVGGLVLRQATLDALSSSLRSTLLSTGHDAAAQLNYNMRQRDVAAYASLANSLTVVTLTDAQRSAWANAYATTRSRLSQQGIFPAALVSQLEGYVG